MHPRAVIGPGVNETFPISVCMIVRDEEENLREGLREIAAIADQLVVVDTGSRDGTKEVAKAFGAEVTEWAWRDDFAAARNRSIELATGAWIIWFDADDRVAPEDVPGFRMLRTVPARCGVAFPLRNMMPGQIGERWAQLRAFPNDGRVRFEGRIHEQLGDSLRRYGYPMVVVDEVEILHLGYADPETRRKKALRNFPLIRSALERDPHDALLGFSLAETFAGLEDYEAAERQLVGMLESTEAKGLFELAGEVRVRIAQTFFARGRFAEALEWVERVLERGANDALALHLGAGAALAAGDVDRAERYYRLVTDAPEHLSMTRARDTRGLRGTALISLARLRVGRAESDDALDLYLRAVHECPEFVEAYAELGRLLLERGRVEEGRSWLRASIERFPGIDRRAYEELATLLRSEGSDDEAAALLREFGLTTTAADARPPAAAGDQAPAVLTGSE